MGLGGPSILVRLLIGRKLGRLACNRLGNLEPARRSPVCRVLEDEADWALSVGSRMSLAGVVKSLFSRVSFCPAKRTISWCSLFNCRFVFNEYIVRFTGVAPKRG